MWRVLNQDLRESHRNVEVVACSARDNSTKPFLPYSTPDWLIPASLVEIRKLALAVKGFYEIENPPLTGQSLFAAASTGRQQRVRNVVFLDYGPDLGSSDLATELAVGIDDRSCVLGPDRA